VAPASPSAICSGVRPTAYATAAAPSAFDTWRETRPALGVQLQVRRPDLRVVRLTERQDPLLGPARHRGDPRVVRVQYGGAARHQRLDQLALGQRDVVLAAELADVRGPDVQHQADLRRSDAAQIGEVAQVPRAHLRDQELRGVRRLQRGQRVAELVVERTLRRHGLAVRADQLGDQVLGTGLAGRSGQADHGQPGQPADHEPGQVAECLLRVGDDDTRRTLDSSGGQ
jgi:hypothetical protein